MLNLLSLGYWKYTGFLMQIVSDLTGWQFALLENTVTLLLLGISVLYVVTGTYNPFIYFQF
ncbi:MAG: hypothetical protein HFI61_07665 [Lachnospiraceae bacterium]|nr:hypothetical protein [Lachnospiraceae bacterium]